MLKFIFKSKSSLHQLLYFSPIILYSCNRTGGCNRTPTIGQLQLKKHHTKSAQLNPPITELITKAIVTTTYPEKRKLGNFKNGVILEMFVQNVIVVCGNFLTLVWLPTELDSTWPYYHDHQSKSCNFFDCYWFKKFPLPTDSLAKLLSDSLLSNKFVIEQFNT